MMVEGVAGGEISVIPVVACDMSSPSPADKNYMIKILAIGKRRKKRSSHQ